MKKFRRIMALLLATIMVLSMGTVAFAAKDTKHTITVNNEDQVGNHTYEAYQVFKGDYDTESKTLSNIEWGNGVDSAAVLAAVKADTATFGADAAKAETASDVAALLGTGKDTAVAKKFAAIVGDHLGTAAGTSTDGVIDVTGDGYYFVKDKAGTVPTDDDNKDPLVGDSETRYILKVVEDTTVTAKSGTVESKKKVDDVNDSTGEGSELKDSADYDIGDDIPYTLTFKLPANYADYATYKVAFIDDMSVGLTYNDDAKIYYGASDKTGTAIAFSVDSEATSEYAGGKVYKATIADLKTAAPDLKAGDEITIKYTAKLNAGAVLGSAGNPNKYQVEYSNNPNGNGESTGKTPWDKNIVFTYKTVFNKVDGEKKALTGADFKLEKKVGNDVGNTLN